MKLKPPQKLPPLPLGLLGGPAEFEDNYPSEMSKLGTLTAYWSLVEDSLCNVLGALLANHAKAEAAFYSTSNHKARRDLVVAVSKQTEITDSAKAYLGSAIDMTKKAADARNDLLHGLFKMEVDSGELVTLHKRPAAKVPEFTRKGVLNEIIRATGLCEVAVNYLRLAALEISMPGEIDRLGQLAAKYRGRTRKALF